MVSTNRRLFPHGCRNPFTLPILHTVKLYALALLRVECAHECDRFSTIANNDIARIRVLQLITAHLHALPTGNWKHRFARSKPYMRINLLRSTWPPRLYVRLGIPAIRI